MSSTAARSGPARVVAVLAARGTPALTEVLSAVSAQTRPPDLLVGVRLGGTDPADRCARAAAVPLRAHSHELVDADADAGPGEVVAAALASGCCAPVPDSAAATDWLWLLDDDSVPDPRALELLLDAVDRAPRVAVAGVKHRGGPEGIRLLDAGYATSRLGRRISGVEDGEVDQGQLDDREDVLAVGLSGALVRRDVWQALGGPDPAVGERGADLDLCRRARLAGHRVVVVPQAVLTRHPHAPEPRGPDEHRVRAHLRLTGAPWWAVPGVAVSIVLGAVARVLLGIAAKEPGTGWAAARQSLAALLRVDEVLHARRRAARTRVLPHAGLAPLMTGRRDLARWHRDRWQRRRAPGAGASLAAPLPVLPLDPRPAGRIGSWAVPAALAVAVATASLVAGWRLVDRQPVTGTAWAPAPTGTAELWNAARSSWMAAGLGADGPPDALWWVLAVLGAPLGSPSALVTVLVVSGPLLGAAAAWWATGAVTRSPWWRAVAGLAWAAAPTLAVALADARVGALLAHVSLPLVVRLVAQSASSRRRRASWAWAGAASLLLLPVTTGAPGLLPVAVLALLGVGIAARRVAPAVAAVPALSLAGPALVAALETPALLVADPGLPSSGSAGPWALRGWEPLLGWPGTAAEGSWAGRVVDVLGLPAGGWPADAIVVLVWTAAAVPLVLALCALPTALRPGARGTAVRAGLLLAASGLVTALAVSRTEVALGPDGPVTGWTGAAASVVLLGLGLAGVAGSAGLFADRTAPKFGRAARRGLLGVATAVAVLLPLLGLTAWSLARAELPVAGEAVPAGELALPAVIADVAVSPDRVRTLALGADPAADLSAGVPSVPDLRVALLRGDGPRLDRVPTSLTVRQAHAGGDPADPAAEVLDAAVARLLSADADARTVLAPFGVGSVVVVAPQGPGGDDAQLAAASARLAALLDSVDGLSRSGIAGDVVAWRVEALSDQGASAPDRPGAVRVVSADGWEVVPSTAFGVATSLPAGEPGVERSLALAERSDPHWRATLDGAALSPTTVGGWGQGFALPPQGGDLVVEHRTGSEPLWHWGQLVVLVLALLVAVPVRRGARVPS